MAPRATSLSSLRDFVPPFSACPGLTPWAAFCRRFAAGVWWFALRASPTFLSAHPLGLKPASICDLTRRWSAALPRLYTRSFVCRVRSKSKAAGRGARSTRARLKSTSTSTAKASAAGVCVSHPCAKNAQGWGSLAFRVARARVRGNGRGARSTQSVFFHRLGMFSCHMVPKGEWV